MQLDHYLFFNKISQKDFAQKTGVLVHTISLIVNKKQGPSLVTALRIYYATNKQVTFSDMLMPKDLAIFNKFCSDLKNESL